MLHHRLNPSTAADATIQNPPPVLIRIGATPGTASDDLDGDGAAVPDDPLLDGVPLEVEFAVTPAVEFLAKLATMTLSAANCSSNPVRPSKVGLVQLEPHRLFWLSSEPVHCWAAAEAEERR